jgi:hypothetical protein
MISMSELETVDSSLSADPELNSERVKGDSQPSPQHSLHSLLSFEDLDSASFQTRASPAEFKPDGETTTDEVRSNHEIFIERVEVSAPTVSLDASAAQESQKGVGHTRHASGTSELSVTRDNLPLPRTDLIACDSELVVPEAPPIDTTTSLKDREDCGFTDLTQEITSPQNQREQEMDCSPIIEVLSDSDDGCDKVEDQNDGGKIVVEEEEKEEEEEEEKKKEEEGKQNQEESDFEDEEGSMFEGAITQNRHVWSAVAVSPPRQVSPPGTKPVVTISKVTQHQDIKSHRLVDADLFSHQARPVQIIPVVLPNVRRIPPAISVPVVVHDAQGSFSTLSRLDKKRKFYATVAHIGEID